MVTRKAFLVQLAGGGWLLATGGCGGGGDAYGSGPAPAAGGCGATSITDNHGHALAIPTADLSSATDKTYSIQGAADHGHDVTFSAAQLAQLKAGQAVMVTSTIAFSHSHDVTEACA
jgi:hypothetical protein